MSICVWESSSICILKCVKKCKKIGNEEHCIEMLFGGESYSIC